MASTTSLVFDGVTVVDVEQGKLVPSQRVVIAGNRIQAVEGAGAVKLTKGAQVVDARGKYLIPGLWDLHTHTARTFFYPLFLANGVTGIRDAGSPVPIDTLLLWRREILAGTRVGPPRQLLSGQSIAGPQPDCQRSAFRNSLQTCVANEDDARHVVDSLKAAGADMIKPRMVQSAMYRTIAAEARRLGIPFGGHALAQGLTAEDVVEGGARIVDHGGAEWMSGCWGSLASVEKCQPLAERFRRNGTWFVPALFIEGGGGGQRAKAIAQSFRQGTKAFWSDSARHENWFRNAVSPGDMHNTSSRDSTVDSLGILYVMQRVGLPILAGSDITGMYMGMTTKALAGFSLHAELAMYVAEGLTVLEALQSATLNPAKMLHATDSLGTVARGKLADLVLLDANPLADITNTTTIRAVVANGRYYDRAALDSLLAEVRAKAKQEP